jgi:hypothetical protein
LNVFASPVSLRTLVQNAALVEMGSLPSIETETKYAYVLWDDLRDALEDYVVLGDGPTLADPRNKPRDK